MKFGLIGLGNISKYYIRAMGKNLTAVCDTNRAKLAKFKVRKYVDARAFSLDKSFDAAVICLPNKLHYSAIKASLLNNKHVLCEKPLVLNLSQAYELAKLARTKKLQLKTAFHRSYNNVISDFMANPKVHGNIKKIKLRYLEDITTPSNGETWYFEAGNGCVMDNGTNVVNIIQRLVGHISIESTKLWFRRGQDRKAIVRFSYAGGSGSFALDWDYVGDKKDITIYTDKTTIYRNFTADYKNPKDSLWHEYGAVVSEFVRDTESGRLEFGGPGISALRVVRAILG